MRTNYEETWDLDVFFSGGSESPQFAKHLQSLRKQLSQFEEDVKNWEVPTNENDTSLLGLLEKIQKIHDNMGQAGAFVSCLQAQNSNDSKANELRGFVTTLQANLESIHTLFDEKISAIDEKTWLSLFKQPAFQEIKFVLNEKRKQASEKLPKEQEALIHALSVDGYHGWGEMYDTIVGKIKIPFEENGVKTELSVGQAANKFSSSDPQVRQQIFTAWENAWEQESDLLADTLNHLAGFRLSVYNQRQWDDFLKEALTYNRMSEKTLNVMWEAISAYKQPFVDFLYRKAELLGVEQLSWQDLDAPIGTANKTYSYQEGADFILKHFSEFGHELPRFTETAFEERWIEAEDRPGKRPGGFCTSFPSSKQSRIFMTYSGTPGNVSTLAHELGHAFHSYVLEEMNPANRDYAMNVAETASTFAEMIVADAAVREAQNEDEKLALLEDKIQRSVALLMNIHARFLFETRFYEERKNGIVSKKRLDELMTEAQKEAYGDALKEYHPLFWGSKLHFFITDVPFYNFPYTFGYLFSLGIYAKALKEGKNYEKKYIALLQDTGSMTVEELAQKHLNVDLTKKDFWEQGIRLCIQDVQEFMQMTRKA
ncbi:pepF/M3 family oligoendopeptidase [Lederbergia galactosidilyticus]|uniref:M3 family oligoendopeptidase n=1 Tax=Lederbergia galactosidilytica TaxID=217031 RepID=UPI001AE2AA7B|nr:M3 family oligoendopeptidase [Lederbergia galactosidilytica]MBP1914858.1 pepF/M3 family oligoendopeptidase [Lederbergia galactosidilytica]